MMYMVFKTNEVLDVLIEKFKEKVLPKYHKKFIWVTGGGAVRFQEIFEREVGLKVKTEPEMASIYDGMVLTFELNANLIYTLGSDLSTKKWATKEFKGPILIANIGSGVSFIKIENGGYTRLGGTPLGGATFSGLCRQLIGLDDFEEIIELCSKGDDKNVDLTLEDFSKVGQVKVESNKQGTIQEERLNSNASCVVTDNVTFVTLGLLPQLNQEERKNIKDEDIAKSMLHLISFNITELAYLYAQIHKLDTIIFTGSFINGSLITQRLMVRGQKFFTKCQGHETNAYFSVHDGFFGALACIKREFDESNCENEMQGLMKSDRD